ncbi:MAG TPA: MraY family glycosyltransferase [Thermomicrobiales bacterium]|nr:MraY family glycosyltransferase [Thermomicrobiales bacterium]
MPLPALMLLIFAVALVGALVGVPLAAQVGALVGLVDRPRPGEVQRRALKRAGGYGIIAAFFLAVAVSLPFADRVDVTEFGRLAGLAFGAALLVPFAAWDDARRLGPLPQLVAQIACAAVPVAFGVRLTSVSSPFGGIFDLTTNLPWLVVPATLFWIVGMTNTLNWIDTMDGLAGGVALITAVVLVIASLRLALPQYTIALLPLALAGACLGFLAYNFPPARIIMGTGGSMFLGYALGVLSIIGGAKIATAALVLGIPIIDTALVIMQRLAGGRSPFHGGDGRHLVHRLLAAGLSVRQIVVLLYALTALFGSLSLFLLKVQKFYAFAGVLAAIALLFLFLKRRGALIAPLTGEKKYEVRSTRYEVRSTNDE